MIFDFPYIRHRGQYMPLVFLTISCREKAISTHALVDAGATVSLFHKDVAGLLGIEIGSGPELQMEGAAVKFHIHLHRVSLMVGTKSFEAEVGFSAGYRGRFNLIGRQGFFEQFNVTYDDRRRRLRLET